MSFDTIEKSIDSGRPLELLKVSYLTNHYCYTTAESEVAYDGFLYMPLPISHNEVSPTGDITRSSITIRVPKDCEVGELFRVQPPSGVVTVTLFTKHVDDGEVKVIWKGRIINAEWEEPWLVLTSENAFSSLQRLGVRRKYSSQCPHALYGQGDGLCNVNPDTFKQTHNATTVSGVTVSCDTAAGNPSAYFAGGKATWVHNVKGYLEQRMITESSGGVITLASPPHGLAPGQPVTLYPGCDHSLATCHGKFANALNFGGTPFIPQKNPFGGSTLY